MSVEGCEIERVYLLDGMPEPLKEGELWRIEQGYLIPQDCDQPVGASAEGRIRRLERPDGAVTFIHTIKRGLGLIREEREHELTEAEFERLWPATEGRRIQKERTRIREGSLVWELDRFIGLDLVLAEVELPDPEASVALPAWLRPHVVREVTEDPKYRNFELARSSGLLDSPQEGP